MTKITHVDVCTRPRWVREQVLAGMTPSQRRKAQKCAEEWDNQSQQIRGWTSPIAEPTPSGWTFRVVSLASAPRAPGFRNLKVLRNLRIA